MTFSGNIANKNITHLCGFSYTDRFFYSRFGRVLIYKKKQFRNHSRHVTACFAFIFTSGANSIPEMPMKVAKVTFTDLCTLDGRNDQLGYNIGILLENMIIDL